MFIKTVVIQGFRSYREQTTIDTFDKGHNVVVGRNGSGKSNFFFAIQFVLSDEFSHLRPEQRQALLHEGTGPRVVQAYVEIIFDNTDNRLPIEKEEVALRRVIGSKKDQYFLNRKMVTKTDVMNLLESAGFSRSNPYYIVKQGKINQMATAPNNYRLKLLREVAGTRVYDERKEESKTILKETESKRDKIKELLKYIEDRLNTLETEKEELKTYQKLDKQRRALEYTIFDLELKDTRTKLEDISRRRDQSGSENEKIRDQIKDCSDHAKEHAKKGREIKSKIHTLKEEKETIAHENNSVLQEKTKLELRITDLNDEVKGDANSKSRAVNELELLEKKIKEKQAELDEIKPKYEEMKSTEDACTRDLSLKEQMRKELYTKHSRGSHFTSKEERNKWINKELKSLGRAIKDKEDQIKRLDNEIERDKTKKVELDKKIEELTGEVENHRSSIDNQNKQFYEMKKKKDTLQSERNDLWRQENAMQQTLSTNREDMNKKEQGLRSMIGKTILNGRDSVTKVLQTFRDRGNQKTADGYFGLLIDAFRCDDQVYTAVEVTAGNKLFYHVVDSDKTGTMILKEMNRQKLPGEVTFMPLNRIVQRATTYPQTNDSVPMIDKLEFETMYESVLRFIFGKTLICRTLEVAGQMARTAQMDCITLEGDKVSHKGALTGGYYDRDRSRLKMHREAADLRVEVTNVETALKDHRTKLNDIEQKINSVVGEMQKTETKNSKSKDVFDQLRTDIRLMKEELGNIDRQEQPKSRTLDSLRSSLDAMRASEDSFKKELEQDLLNQLSVRDQEDVDTLNDEIKKLTQKNKEAFSERLRLEAAKNKLENLLSNNLMRRKDELNAALQEISVEDRKRRLESSSSELDSLRKRLHDLGGELERVDRALTKEQKLLKREQEEVDVHKNRERELQEKLSEDAKELDRMTSKTTVLLQKKEEYTKKIRELGSLPADSEKYQKQTIKQLWNKLDKCNADLKKYSHVNKKALDQFVNFSEQKEKLEKRKEELDRAYTSIKDLMDVLDQRKNEAIQFTFKQVSKYFTEVFLKLAPQGKGQLVMKKGDEESEDAHDKEPFDQYTGIGIKVSFTGRNAEMREMSQLSGGQKSLVALALIFAIQKCDPAPFYLFDEIDQALDAQHRKAVADMIHELAGDAQFITTTFRPELLENANKFYGVKFRNKVSHIECVTREEARDFVEDDATGS